MAKSLLAGHSSDDDDDEDEGEELKRVGDHPEKIFFLEAPKKVQTFFWRLLKRWTYFKPMFQIF